MSISVLINTDKLKFLKASESIRGLEIWAEILARKDDYLITGPEKKWFSAFTMMELKMLYRNTTGKDLNTEDYPKALTEVARLADQVEIDTTPEKNLLKKLGRKMPEFSAKPAVDKGAAKTKSKAATSSQPPKRPKEGTATAKVWDIADTQFKHAPTEETLANKEFKAYVIKLCVDQGINQATAQVQIGKWKKVKEGSI